LVDTALTVHSRPAKSLESTVASRVSEPGWALTMVFIGIEMSIEADATGAEIATRDAKTARAAATTNSLCRSVPGPIVVVI
jgi:hypothetical protein